VTRLAQGGQVLAARGQVVPVTAARQAA
jgi:hypothetical protein